MVPRATTLLFALLLSGVDPGEGERSLVARPGDESAAQEGLQAQQEYCFAVQTRATLVCCTCDFLMVSAGFSSVA